MRRWRRHRRRLRDRLPARARRARRPQPGRPRLVRRHLRRCLCGVAARRRSAAAGDVRRGRGAEPEPAGRRVGGAVPAGRHGVPAPCRPCSGRAGRGAAHQPVGRRAQLERPAVVAVRAAAGRPARDLRDPGVPAARVPRAPAQRPLRRPAARAQRGGGRPRQRRGGRLRAPRPPRRADLEGGPGLDRAAGALPPGAHQGARLRRRRRAQDRAHQSRDPERRRSRSSASTRSCPTSTTPRRAPCTAT